MPLHTHEQLSWVYREEKKGTSISHPNLFLELVLQFKVDHFSLALGESWNIIFLIKFAVEKRTVVLLCPFLYAWEFYGFVVGWRAEKTNELLQRTVWSLSFLNFDLKDSY